MIKEEEEERDLMPSVSKDNNNNEISRYLYQIHE